MPDLLRKLDAFKEYYNAAHLASTIKARLINVCSPLLTTSIGIWAGTVVSAPDTHSKRFLAVLTSASCSNLEDQRKARG